MRDGQPGDPFAYQFYNEANGSAAGIDFSRDFGQEGTFISVLTESQEIGLVLNADAPQGSFPQQQQVFFTSLIPLGYGFQIHGAALGERPVVHSGVVDPLEIPVEVGMFTPPWNRKQVFSLTLVREPPEEPPAGLPQLQIGYEGGNVTLTWEGDWTLQMARTLDDWLTLRDAESPHVVEMSDLDTFFRLISL